MGPARVGFWDFSRAPPPQPATTECGASWQSPASEQELWTSVLGYWHGHPRWLDPQLPASSTDQHPPHTSPAPSPNRSSRTCSATAPPMLQTAWLAGWWWTSRKRSCEPHKRCWRSGRQAAAAAAPQPPAAGAALLPACSAATAAACHSHCGSGPALHQPRPRPWRRMASSRRTVGRQRLRRQAARPGAALSCVPAAAATAATQLSAARSRPVSHDQPAACSQAGTAASQAAPQALLLRWHRWQRRLARRCLRLLQRPRSSISWGRPLSWKACWPVCSSCMPPQTCLWRRCRSSSGSISGRGRRCSRRWRACSGSAR